MTVANFSRGGKVKIVAQSLVVATIELTFLALIFLGARVGDFRKVTTCTISLCIGLLLVPRAFDQFAQVIRKGPAIEFIGENLQIFGGFGKLIVSRTDYAGSEALEDMLVISLKNGRQLRFPQSYYEPSVEVISRRLNTEFSGPWFQT